jgi:hypothetical protein
MGGKVLTTATVASCPHGGQASFVASQSAVQIDSAPALVVSDTTTIAGCSFMIGNVPSPCLTVQWQAPATKVTAGGTAVLLDSSTGLCMSAASAPQGSLQITQVQAKVTAT